MNRVHTFCRVCEPSCGLVAEVEAGVITRLRPDASHPVTRGFACHKGMGYLDIHHDPDRLDTPIRRSTSASGGFERISWDDATSTIGAELARIRDAHGPDAIAGYIGNPTAFNALASQAIMEFFGALGSRTVFSSSTQDCSNKFAASEAVYGTSTLHPIPDIERTDCLILFGENPRVSHMSFISIADPMAKIEAAVARGAQVFYINPRAIESAGPGSGEVVQILPDTDVYLLAALLHELDTRGAFRIDVIEAHGRNVEALRAFVAPYTPESVADVVGISAERIHALASAWQQAKRASAHMSTGANMGRQGTLVAWLVQMLVFVTGNLDVEGGNIYGEGFYAATKAGKIDLADVYFESPFGPMRTVRGALPGALAPDMILHPTRPIRALVVVAGNPVLSVSGEDRWREALDSLELVVVLDLFRNATAEHAHFVLPTTDMLERADVNICGLGMQYEPFVQFTDAVVTPAAERREEWWILARLQQAIGLPSLLDQPMPAPFVRIDRMLSRSELSTEKLRQEPAGTSLLPRRALGRFYSDFIQTADKRVDCCPSFFADAITASHVIFGELETAPPRFRLINLRHIFMHNSWYQNVPKLKRGRNATNALHVHPSDLHALGIADGHQVAVHNEHGRLEVSTRADESLRPGVVAMTHGWGNSRSPGLRVASRHPGVNVNALLPSGPGSYERLSNQAFMSGVPVNVTRI